LVGLPDHEGKTPGNLDRARVQKALFILGRELTLPEFYEFHPYHYGPFAREVYDDAEGLIARGLIQEIPVPNQRYTVYIPTAQGVVEARRVSAEIPRGTQEFLLKVRAWVQSLDFNTLVKAIYAKWPEMRENSIFKD
jgi:uncharacterized protein YwgA